MDVEEFVLSHLPRPPARVLEVGCGDGRLAMALATRKYGVTAIDPDAPEGDIFRRVPLEDFSDEGSFDAIVASRSLHHVENLQAGVDKIHALLRRGGVLILNEFAWDQMDEATARWYQAHVEDPSPKDDSLHPHHFPDAWITEHEGLHPFSAMRRSLDRRFALKTFEWVPYIAHHYLERDDLIDQERVLIQAEKINPLGFRYVGVRT